jgi:hypothetical protein
MSLKDRLLNRGAAKPHTLDLDGLPPDLVEFIHSARQAFGDIPDERIEVHYKEDSSGTE